VCFPPCLVSLRPGRRVPGPLDFGACAFLPFSLGPAGDCPDAKAPPETLRKRNGSFPSVKSDFPTPQGPREAQTPVSGMSKAGRLKPPFRGCQKIRFQALPEAFLTPKRPPKRCENATVRSLRGCQKIRFQALPEAFLTPKRPPKRCENATVRSQVPNLIFPLPKAPGRLKPPFPVQALGESLGCRDRLPARRGPGTGLKLNPPGLPEIKEKSSIWNGRPWSLDLNHDDFFGLAKVGGCGGLLL